jgi:hypothetical protein
MHISSKAFARVVLQGMTRDALLPRGRMLLE